MLRHLANHFRTVRQARGLTMRDLAVLVGYRDSRKIAGRIGWFEQTGSIKEELLARLADALGIEYPTVEPLLAEGGRETSPATLGRAETVKGQCPPDSALKTA